MDEDYHFDFNASDYNSTSTDFFIVEYYTVPAVIAFINLIGLFGNGALALILRKTPITNAPYVCILNLAISDLIVLIFYLPFAITDSFPFGNAICKITETLADISTGVSAFTLIALAGYSFFSRETEASRTEWSRQNVTIVVASIWVLAFVFAAPTLFFAHVTHVEDTPFKYCDAFDPRFEQAEGPLRFVVYYAIPLSAVCIFYCTAKRNINASISKDNSNVAIWLTVVYGLSFFCENVSMFWVLLPSQEDEYWPLMNMVTYIIGILYRCLNPIVLYCVSDTFRSLFKEHGMYWFSSETREPVLDAPRNREVGTGGEILSQRLL